MEDDMLKREDNPFTLQFSYIPPQYVNRELLIQEIETDLSKKVPTFRGWFLTGVRGSGKTVLMADIARRIEKTSDWIVVDIESPKKNITESLARGLYRNPSLKKMFINAKLDVSVLGLGVSIEKAELIASDEYDAVHMMLQLLKKMEKKVLVTIDEVTYNNNIADFSHSLSAYARAGFEIYVLMTGLLQNVNAIKNDESLTFLYRAKLEELGPLNMTSIINRYENTLRISHQQAEEIAWLTKGYSFAFQLLGYLAWNYLCENDNLELNVLLPSYDQFLAEFSYEKIWSELAPGEKTVLKKMAGIADSHIKVQHLREELSMSSSKFGVYRDRLMEKGLIDGSEYGHVSFVLPRFHVFAQMQR